MENKIPFADRTRIALAGIDHRNDVRVKLGHIFSVATGALAGGVAFALTNEPPALATGIPVAIVADVGAQVAASQMRQLDWDANYPKL